MAVSRSNSSRLRGSFAEVLQHQALEISDLAALAAEDPDLLEALLEMLGRMHETARSLHLDVVADAALAAREAVAAGGNRHGLGPLLELCRSLDPTAADLRPVLVIDAISDSSDPLLLVAPDVESARIVARTAPPLAIVAPVEVLQTLPSEFASVPKCAWGEPGDIHQRVEAARLGALAFFATPLDLQAINQRVRLRLLPHDIRERVLLVGASPSVAEHWSSHLALSRIELVPCDSPDLLLQLQEVEPALILLCGPESAELSMVLRGHPDWWDVRRVVLSETPDEGVVDLTLPPLLPAAAIRARTAALLDQVRYEHEQRALERSTGVMQRAALLRTLEREVATSRRARRTLAVARVDLAEPGLLQQVHGAAALTSALRLLALSILDVVRASDVVGRLGDNGYGIVMPGATAAAVRTRVREIGARFSELSHRDSRLADVTTSAGVADTSESDERLFQRAERDRLSGRGN